MPACQNKIKTLSGRTLLILLFYPYSIKEWCARSEIRKIVSIKPN